MKREICLLVAGLSLSAASVVIAGPVNASFDDLGGIGPVHAPGPLPPFTNGWAVQAAVPILGGAVPVHASPYGLGLVDPTDGPSFAVLSVFPFGGVTEMFLTSDVFTVGATGATMTFDYFFDNDPGSIGFFGAIGTATPMGGNPAAPVDLIPGGAIFSTPWTPSAPVALGAGDWALSFALFGLVGPTPDAFFGLDKISVTDNPPFIPLPTGAAMAMVGMGVIGVRRRRN